MSKKNQLSWADLGLVLNEDFNSDVPAPSKTILDNVPPTSGTEEALSLIDGEASAGMTYKPEMQGQPEDAPEDRKVESVPNFGAGVTSGKGSQSGGSQASGSQSSGKQSGGQQSGGSQSGGQQSGGQQSGGQQSDDNKPAFLQKKDESFKLGWADLGLMEDEEDKGQQDQGQQSGGQQASGQQGGQQSSGQQSGGQQSGGQQSESPFAGQQNDGTKGVSDSSGAQSSGGQQSADGITVDSDLLRNMLKAAVEGQPDDGGIDMIVQAITSCCNGGTLTMADSDSIMNKLKELTGGQQAGQQAGQQGSQQMGGQQGQQAPMGGQQGSQMGQQDPAATDAIPSGDGQQAGAEGGQQHQGKTKLMGSMGESTKVRGKKMALNEAWVMGVPGVGSAACMGEAAGDGEEDIDEDTVELRRMARRAGMAEWFNVGR